MNVASLSSIIFKYCFSRHCIYLFLRRTPVRVIPTHITCRVVYECGRAWRVVTGVHIVIEVNVLFITYNASTQKVLCVRRTREQRATKCGMRTGGNSCVILIFLMKALMKFKLKLEMKIKGLLAHILHYLVIT